MIFILSFSVFVATLPSISLFCPFLNLPLPSTPVWKFLSVYFFAFLMLIFFDLSHTIASSFCPALSINPAPASFFFEKKKNCSFVLICFLWDFYFISALGFTLFFCSYLLFLGLSISALGFTPLLVLLLALGGWRFCSCCCCGLGFGEN